MYTVCGLSVLESDSEPEETTVRVSRRRGGMHRKEGVVAFSGKSTGSTASAPQKGILKDKKAAPAAMTLTREEQKKRVRFSLEGKSPADTTDHGDSSSDEDDDAAAVEMEAEDSDDDDFIIETDDLGEIR